LIVSAGTKSNAAMPTVRICQRLPRMSAAPRTRRAAAPSIVRCVPIKGIVMRAETKVPRMLPRVESA